AAETVIEVDEMRSAVGPENVARVAVAVQADAPWRDRLEDFLDQLQRLSRGVQEIRPQVGRQPVAGGKEVDAFMAHGMGVQLRAVIEHLDRSHRMDASDEAAQPFELVHFAGLWCSAVPPR